MHNSVVIEPDDLIEYATKKYDIEDDEAEAWHHWIRPDIDVRTQSYILDDMLSPGWDNGDNGPDHPQTKAHNMLIDYMTDHRFAKITLTQ
jgi:hypothetical protein